MMQLRILSAHLQCCLSVMTIVILLFSDYAIAQRWLLMVLPQHRSDRYYYQTPIQSEQFPPVVGMSAGAYGGGRHYQFHNPAQATHQIVYQPATRVPVIAPVIITEYGSNWLRKEKESDEDSRLVMGIVGNEDSGSTSTELDNNISVLQPTKVSLMEASDSPNRCVLEGNQAHYDPVTSSCHTIGTKGPCGDFMIFTAMPDNSLNGYCDCDYESYDRPLVYLEGQCYFFYSGAVCHSGYWLTPSPSPLNPEPRCEPNPCHHLTLANPLMSISGKNPFVVFQDECVRLNSSSRHCRRAGEVVLFPKGSTQPACGFPKSTRRIYRRQISNVSRFTCAPGMKRHKVTKKCVRTRAIVFA